MLSVYMNEEKIVLIDFVVRNTPDEWKLVLVEQGPWRGEITEELRRFQTRLYEVLDAALEGSLLLSFRNREGRRFVLQWMRTTCRKLTLVSSLVGSRKEFYGRQTMSAL